MAEIQEKIMRLFLTSYQKSGTHQIMPALDMVQDIVDRSHNTLRDLPKRYGRNGDINHDGVQETCHYLRAFDGRQFGHISYLSEYAEALQSRPTKVLFNFRDPRDVVIAEYYSVGKNGYPNLYIEEYGKNIADIEDPITELIEIAAVRWPRWLGWLDHDFVMPVRYEELRLNGCETMEKIREWLLPYEIDPVEICVKRLNPKPRNPTFRRGVPGEWKTGMTDEQKKLSEKLLGNIIEKLGYEV